ncbi:hypothetical protein [Caballeronia sp. dw_276]|uniref:hypothetical protein n=1 Tax=Caballeronia sp. dw_276 TaxID=2719795 RepID=UPI001BD2D9FC|nr:hypothetical protein [Caballeronia sp. dw_276]
MTMDLAHLKHEFTATLKDRPRGTTANITEHTVIFLDGKEAVGVHLIADPPGFEGRFELDDYFLGDAHEHLTHWFENPEFSSRPDLVAWLDAGMDKSTEL